VDGAEVALGKGEEELVPLGHAEADTLGDAVPELLTAGEDDSLGEAELLILSLAEEEALDEAEPE
jgi:hypothetical protein